MTENHGVASSILALGILGLTQVDNAGMVQLVEHLLAKEKVTGSSPVARSIFPLLADSKWDTHSICGQPNYYGDVAKLERQGSAKP